MPSLASRITAARRLARETARVGERPAAGGPPRPPSELLELLRAARAMFPAAYHLALVVNTESADEFALVAGHEGAVQDQLFGTVSVGLGEPAEDENPTPYVIVRRRARG